MTPAGIRPAAVAGSFYPANPSLLARAVYGFVEEGRRHIPAGAAAVPKALIVPHAGYVYSGAVAAPAYARIASLKGRITRVVLIGPCHRVAVRGIAVPEARAFVTPLGEIEVDAAAVDRIRNLPGVVASGAAHAQDHALEVQLPFLQQVLGTFRLVPLLVGSATADQVGAVLERLWGGPETLVVISSDLSHYLPYEDATSRDRNTVNAVLRLDPCLVHEDACGATPVNGLIGLARRHGMTVELLDLRNSGDTAGDRARVVGYASLAFHEPVPVPEARVDSVARGNLLVRLARAAIGEPLGIHIPVEDDAPFLREPGATFVTLKQGSQLRGCIGSLNAHRTLLEDVRHNAAAAAFADPRFRKLEIGEFGAIRVEVSLLAAAQPLHFKDQADLIAQLRPGVDGLILECGVHRSTFLPQVWESLPAPSVFLAHLKAKAGLPHDFWSPNLRVSRYAVEKWAEP
jgi:AmmeMemoRadiSam system protein B/AmmeMemoRadiSam system protein A